MNQRHFNVDPQHTVFGPRFGLTSGSVLGGLQFLEEGIMKLKVTAISYQRNGITGAGFHVVDFTTSCGLEHMAAIVFEEPKYVAVITPWEGDRWIETHWRGDYFEAELRKAIAKWGEQQSKKLAAS